MNYNNTLMAQTHLDVIILRRKRMFSLSPKTRFNPFPHDKILDQAKLKAFADDKLNVTKMMSLFDTPFLLFPQCFQKASFPDPSKCVSHIVNLNVT